MTTSYRPNGLKRIIPTPFMGVGSEVYASVFNGRRGIGIELKPSYFRPSLKNMENLKYDKASHKEQTVLELTS